ncbi:hypothetical protein RI367_004549 [Sorochytrium milnesiophthora]
MIRAIFIFSRHGKIRLKKWFRLYSAHEKTKFTQEIMTDILARRSSMCNVVEWKGQKLVYRRYASLYFCACIDWDDNELITLETIHRYVQCLDEYFGNVCELDIIFNFQSAYMILDELIIGGEQQETSRKAMVSTIKKIDEVEKESLIIETLQGANLA